MPQPGTPDEPHSSQGSAAAAGDKPASHAHPRQAILASFIAEDEKSKALVAQVQKIALSSTTVLIRGESGVGKGLLASVLHFLGAHADEPFLQIDCASLPHSLMESELFGYERGAFTGATAMKQGRLELAGPGTVVLDEIAALSSAMQAKLLRVLEERRFERLGGVKTVALADDLRIVAITNVDLEEAVRQRTFREDLFYRLNVIPVVIPPLRERTADVAPLAAHFTRQLAAVHGKGRRHLSPEAIHTLQEYSFPGNVRELRNLIERCVVTAASEEIGADDLPLQVHRQAPPASHLTLETMERAHIAAVLDSVRGKKSEAAEILGISRKTLLEKRKRYKLDEPT